MVRKKLYGVKLIYLIRALGRLKFRTEQTNTKLQSKQQVKRKAISFHKATVKDEMMHQIV